MRSSEISVIAVFPAVTVNAASMNLTGTQIITLATFDVVTKIEEDTEIGLDP